MAEVRKLADIQHIECGVNVVFAARISRIKVYPGKYSGLDIFFEINDGDVKNYGRMFNMPLDFKFDTSTRVAIITAQRAKSERQGVNWNVSQVHDSDLPCREFIRKAPNQAKNIKNLSSQLEKMESGRYGNVGLIAARAIRKHWLEFITWPASQNRHHNYMGGLLEHVLEAQHNALKYYYTNLEKYPDCDINLVEVGCLIHDIGKVKTMYLEESTGDILSTPYMELSNHSIEGINIIRQFGDIDLKVCLALQHLIAAHHCALFNGAIMEPKFVEVLLVNIGDSMSGKYNYQASIVNASNLVGWRSN